MIKPIAYYLPQFHRIPENDQWWGDGFTEWTNVRKATSLFEGHQQPKIPWKYYDLSDTDVIHEQVQMAKEHHVYGFCFYYYWFGGKRLLQTPVENFLKDSRPGADFPFMLCWANENWTRRWDGLDQDVLIEQQHSIQDHHKVADDFIRHFNDSRYIKIDNKPVLMIYRPGIIDHCDVLFDVIREKAVANDFDDVHIIGSTAGGFTNEQQLSINGIAEFPPHFIFENGDELKELSHLQKPGLSVYDYKTTVEQNINNYCTKKPTPHAYYPGVFPSWDCTPRRKDGVVFANCSNQDFMKWFAASCLYTKRTNTSNDQFVFINAWNEWAEGAILEPDNFNGLTNLKTIQRVMQTIK